MVTNYVFTANHNINKSLTLNLVQEIGTTAMNTVYSPTPYCVQSAHFFVIVSMGRGGFRNYGGEGLRTLKGPSFSSCIVWLASSLKSVCYTAVQVRLRVL